MNAKKHLVLIFSLNVALLFAANPRSGAHECSAIGSRMFGPVKEIVLPAPKGDEPEILDFESGRFVRQEPLEHFKFRAGSIMAWIRSKGLDISCKVWSTGAACVTYDMTLVPIAGKSAEKVAESEVLGNRLLAPGRHAPRRLLVLGKNQPDTYIFRTGDGTLGVLQLIGLSKDGRGVKIRYRLIEPAESFTMAG